MWLEIKNTPIEPLSTAIPADKWREYLQNEEEKSAKAAKDFEEQIEQQKLKELEQTEIEADEQHTLLLKNKVLEAERAMLLPIPPYPVPHPPQPTLETIFRKPLNQVEISRQPCQEVKKEEAKETPVTPQVQAYKQQITGDLLPPPDMRFSKPLDLNEIKKPKFEEPVQVNEIAPPKVEYEYIPVDQPINRQDTVDIITKSVTTATEDWKKWIFGLLEYEQQQWNLRSVALQKAKDAREEHRLAMIDKQAQKRQIKSAGKKKPEKKEKK